jgi:hypothetical protein
VVSPVIRVNDEYLRRLFSGAAVSTPDCHNLVAPIKSSGFEFGIILTVLPRVPAGGNRWQCFAFFRFIARQ